MHITKRGALAERALYNLLNGNLHTIIHPSGWQCPPDWPLAIKVTAPAADGTLTRTYRPIALLEWVNKQVQNEIAASRMPTMHVAKVSPKLPKLPSLPALPTLPPLPRI